jgi:hypothetical protein
MPLNIPRKKKRIGEREMSRKNKHGADTRVVCYFFPFVRVCMCTENVNSLALFSSSSSSTLFSISFPHLEGAQQNDPPPSDWENHLTHRGERITLHARSNQEKHNRCSCNHLAVPCLHPSISYSPFFPFFLIFLLPYVIFTMRARMIEVTTVGSRLRVSRDDDLELLSIPFAPRLSPPRRLNATTRATTTSREAKFEANEAEMSLTTQLPSRGSEWNVKTRPQFCITGKTLIPGTGHNFRDLFLGCSAVYSAQSEWTLHPLSISSN